MLPNQGSPEAYSQALRAAILVQPKAEPASITEEKAQRKSTQQNLWT